MHSRFKYTWPAHGLHKVVDIVHFGWFGVGVFGWQFGAHQTAGDVMKQPN